MKKRQLEWEKIYGGGKLGTQKNVPTNNKKKKIAIKKEI